VSYHAAVLADSVSPDGVRLTTLMVRFPRFILAEFNTPRMFSRSSASSRAIPTELFIEQVRNDPFIPETFNRRVRGMGIGDELDAEASADAEAAWRTAAWCAVNAAERLMKIGIDKSRANRVLEPYLWHTAIFTATEWSNFFALRCPPRGVLCADGHVGYSQPIGGAVAYADYISPSGVGYDIACGNKAVRTNLLADDVAADVPGSWTRSCADQLRRRPQEQRARRPPGARRDRDADFAPQRQLYDLAAKQLGTVGAGNHYVDLFEDDDGYVWIGVHFGSRGFGHKTASGFLALAEGKRSRSTRPRARWTARRSCSTSTPTSGRRTSPR
jgi:hypothetical protein